MAERHEEGDRGRVGLASFAVDRQAGGSRWKWEFARGKHEREEVSWR